MYQKIFFTKGKVMFIWCSVTKLCVRRIAHTKAANLSKLESKSGNFLLNGYNVYAMQRDKTSVVKLYFLQQKSGKLESKSNFLHHWQRMSIQEAPWWSREPNTKAAKWWLAHWPWTMLSIMLSQVSFSASWTVHSLFDSSSTLYYSWVDQWQQVAW